MDAAVAKLQAGKVSGKSMKSRVGRSVGGKMRARRPVAFVMRAVARIRRL